jgi:dTDP-4-dehydrorhamnose reductase
MSSGKRCLVAGSRGRLGTVLTALLGERAAGEDMPELDITDRDSVERSLLRWDPEWILNCAAMTDVDACQERPVDAFRVNSDGVALLAASGRRLLTISTDHVFGGASCPRTPIPESAEPFPVNVYGESKLAGEREALSRPGNIVVRTSWLFDDRSGIVPFLWRSLKEGGRVTAVSDQEASLTYAPDLAALIVHLMNIGAEGVFHGVNPGGTTPFRLAVELSLSAGGAVTESKWDDLGLKAPRPRYSVLGSVRGVEMPSSSDALDRWRRRNG